MRSRISRAGAHRIGSASSPTILVAARPGAPEPDPVHQALAFDAPRLDISSRELRARAARGTSLRYLVPDAVWEHIKERGLYNATASARADMPPRALADLVVEAASDKKAEDILVLNISEVSTIADLFVICSARGERQAQAIADGIMEKAKAAGQQPFGVEGYEAGAGSSSTSATSSCTCSYPRSASSTGSSASGATLRWCSASPNRLALTMACRVPLPADGSRGCGQPPSGL